MCVADKAIFGACNLVRLFQLLIITSCVYKWSINPISNPKPHRESLIHVTIPYMLFYFQRRFLQIAEIQSELREEDSDSFIAAVVL
jgi:hypothetical protein